MERLTNEEWYEMFNTGALVHQEQSIATPAALVGLMKLAKISRNKTVTIIFTEKSDFSQTKYKMENALFVIDKYGKDKRIYNTLHNGTVVIVSLFEYRRIRNEVWRNKLPNKIKE